MSYTVLIDTIWFKTNMTDTTDTINSEEMAESVTITDGSTEPPKDSESSLSTNKNDEQTNDKTEQTNESNEKTETGSDNDDSASKLFVGRLPVATKESQLKELFGTYGEVTHCDVVGKYGFVHMKNKEEASKAMANLNNHSFNGSNITVQFSTSTAKKNKKKQPRRNNGGNNNKQNNGGNNSNRRSSLKNGTGGQNRNKQNNHNGNHRNSRMSMNNGRSNGNNRMNNRNRKSFQNMRMDRSMAPPPHQMSQMGNYYPNQPMNNYYQQAPMPAPQMSPVGGPQPRDMYGSYNNRTPDNSQYGIPYGSSRTNGPAPSQMYGGMSGPIHQNSVQGPSMQSHYYSPYNRGQSTGGDSMNGQAKMGGLQSPPQSGAPQPMYHQQHQNYMNTNQTPMVGNGIGYGQMASTGYGNGPILNSNGANNKYVGFYR